MEKIQLREYVDLIREVFIYTHKFRNSVFVIKIDDRLIDHPYFSVLVRDLALLHHNGVKIVLIPGAVHHIDLILAQYGIAGTKGDGIRVTSKEALPFVKMAAFDVCNRIMTLLAGNQINAVIGNWVRARALGVVAGQDFQFTGQVEKIKTDSVLRLLNEGDIPLFPAIGWNSTGDAYNISTDELAVVLGKSLNAAKLFYVTASDDLKRENHIIPECVKTYNGEDRIARLSLMEADEFLKSNPGKPELELLTRAVAACRSGVERVHIVDGRIEGVILKEIYSNVGIGLMIHSSEFDRIRPMTDQDVGPTLSLIKPFVEKKILLPRTKSDLIAKISNYVVYEVDGMIHGCAAFIPFGTEAGEIAALAVDEEYKQGGTGRKIVEFLTDQAFRRGFSRVFALTTQTADWFLQMGFQYGEVSDLPTEKQKLYDTTRKSRILIRDLKDYSSLL